MIQHEYDGYIVTREIVQNRLQISVSRDGAPISPDDPAFNRAVRGTRGKRGPKPRYSVRLPSVYVEPEMAKAIRAVAKNYGAWARKAYKISIDLGAQ